MSRYYHLPPPQFSAAFNRGISSSTKSESKNFHQNIWRRKKYLNTSPLIPNPSFKPESKNDFLPITNCGGGRAGFSPHRSSPSLSSSPPPHTGRRPTPSQHLSKFPTWQNWFEHLSVSIQYNLPICSWPDMLLGYTALKSPASLSPGSSLQRF